MRTLKFCDICEDAIEISEYEEHSKSHKLKKTEIKKEELVAKPKQEINQNNLNINKSYEDSHDLKRFESIKINCEFCDLQVPDAEFYDHEAMCGARSTKCEYCDKNLLYQQLNNHLKDCNAKIIIEQNAFEDDYDGNEFFSFLIDDVALINKKMQMEEDEKLAQLLEQNTLVDVEKENEDLELAKRMQMELDERLAREYELFFIINVF